MSSAIEQLAAELAKLSAEEWARLPETLIVGQTSDVEVAERTGKSGREAVAMICADESLADTQATVKSGNQA